MINYDLIDVRFYLEMINMKIDTLEAMERTRHSASSARMKMLEKKLDVTSQIIKSLEDRTEELQAGRPTEFK